jgi:FixJ family two-component response regulator
MPMLTNALPVAIPRGATAARSMTKARKPETDRPLVLVVDDDEEVRSALLELFESVGLDAISFASTRELLEKELPGRPGCLVLDIRMPGSSGLDLQQQLASRGDSKPIVFLTGHGDIQMTVQAMKAGAVDFLTKPVRDQTLLDAVTAAIQRDIAQRSEARVVKQHAERFATLTPRERQVLREVAQGRLNKQIAFELGISEVTVKLHRGNMMRKMQAASVGGLVRAWEFLPAALRGDPKPVPRYDSSDPAWSEKDRERGQPGLIREGRSFGQSALGSGRR